MVAGRKFSQCSANFDKCFDSNFCMDSKKPTSIIDADLMEAKIYAAMAREWVRECHCKRQCPASETYKSLSVLLTYIERLEYHLKIKEGQFYD